MSVAISTAVRAASAPLFLAGAVERYRMNLAAPHRHRADDGRVINDYLRRKRGRDGAGTGHLTAELFAAFGTPQVR